jgi:hypothetical protein
MEHYLREILTETIEPSGGDKPGVEIMDPNKPEKKSKSDKMKYKADGSDIEIEDSGRMKMWMPEHNQLNLNNYLNFILNDQYHRSTAREREAKKMIKYDNLQRSKERQKEIRKQRVLSSIGR